MRLHLASGNGHKAAELSALARAANLALEIISAREVGGMPAVTEDAGTFVGNARKKALALQARLPAGAWVLADDSGVCVDALGGAPGVESAYFAGPQGDSAANLAKLVQVMRDVPDGKRAAHFLCVLVAITDQGREIVAEGRISGTLLRTPRGGAGFGYDPMFQPDGHDRTFGELEPEEKHGMPADGSEALSHRARAFQKLARALLVKQDASS